ncbi:MAG TPA: alpha/beta hydrolase [Isosphaeraceae bacterium]|nr:alpha/beta hydrolase [Isosphaeraceae bacterium]
MSVRDGSCWRRLATTILGLALALCPTAGSAAEPPKTRTAPSASELLPGAQEGFINTGGVKIHYVSLGRSQDPLIVMIHGFPDFWYTWRAQMPALAQRFHVVAIDQRGYNLSGQPGGVANYTTAKLVADLVAVVQHFGGRKAVIVGHDWGGLVAWTFAMAHPDLTDRLIVLNLPHPRGILRELATNPNQQKNSQYARDFQKPDAAKRIPVDALAAWVKDPAARQVYREAFRRSSLEGMLNYYKANYPRDADDAKARAEAAQSSPSLPAVKCPVLLIHGLKDQALLPGALNDTWNWIDADLTLVTIPTAGHFVQQDAADLVTRTLVAWLAR